MEIFRQKCKILRCKIPEVPTSSAIFNEGAFKMLASTCQQTTVHMTRNNFSIHEVSINLYLNNIFVGDVKITAFNGFSPF
jgi:hypothetical protein